jgi:hypothetical protein
MERSHKIKSWLSNNGGFNRRTQRFAGNLPASADRESREAILHSPILTNGVRRTTVSMRNHDVILSEVRRHFPPANELRVIDVGCSSGIDSLSTFRALSTDYTVTDFALADREHAVLYEESRGLICDEAGTPLQLKLPLRGFFSLHFSHNFKWQKLLTWPAQITAVILSKVIRPLQHGAVSISLLDTSLFDSRGTLLEPFRAVHFDVFSCTDVQQFDVILCFHLLVPRYFSIEKINLGKHNLLKHVAPGGLLIVGSVESYELWTRRPDGTLERRADAE